ncbi:hypothetical protein [Streptomyces sp. NBC_01237]|uniref:hypothetical protein n=1 Tax=Streptomyces sp. NBC_01237 TaxID=2903790 RepID=UPI002DD8E3D7|nr:hypothetical protein [Streptomyces sp. NBC_01237]WRZ78234.1 hypothetical protein OG251_42480 [Streptomyces sp. NBC_01237]
MGAPISSPAKETRDGISASDIYMSSVVLLTREDRSVLSEHTSKKPAWGSGRRVITLSVALVLGLSAAMISAMTVNGSSGRPVSADLMKDTLRSLLPEGGVSDVSGSGLSETHAPSARLVFDDGHDRSFVEVSVSRLPRSARHVSAECPLRSYSPYDHCVKKTVDGHHALVVNQSYVDPFEPEGAKQWSARLLSRDGVLVSVVQSDVSAEGAGRNLRSALPLTVEELSRIATSKDWEPVMAAVPQAPSPPEPPSTGRMTEREILRNLEKLIPGNLRIANQEGSRTGYADVTVDDGRGESLLTVSVQQWKPGRQELVPLFRNGKNLPGGGRIVTRTAPLQGHPDIVQWDVDVLYDDGRRVLISELNSSSFGTPVTRKAPVLSMEQIKPMALARVWRGD